MSKRFIYALMFAAPLGLMTAACGDDAGDRTALEEDELSRDLDLALQGDTAPTTFEDTLESQDPGEEADVPAAAPARQQPPRTTPAPRPTPQQPQREEPRAEPRPQQPTTVTRTAPSGTTLALRLNETLSTETSSVGDGFTATLSSPVRAADGSVLIPEGAVVRGRVTAVQPSTRAGQTALIKVAYESISWGGRSYDLNATLVEAPVQRDQRTTRGQQAATIGAGAAAGAILGQVLGRDREATLAGAAIGAAAGTAIALGTADVDAVMPAGGRMVIRLDTPVSVTTPR
jgi:hypothetical protein